MRGEFEEGGDESSGDAEEHYEGEDSRKTIIGWGFL